MIMCCSRPITRDLTAAHSSTKTSRKRKKQQQRRTVRPSFSYSSLNFLSTKLKPHITSESVLLFQSFQKCLDLRDKYMLKSRQRLGDNPQDHDGRFPGLDDEIADVSGVRPDSNFRSNNPPPSPFKPWKVYPPPPPPRWHWSNKGKVVRSGNRSARRGHEFVFEDCTIPGSYPWDFDIDDKGVFQVYESLSGETNIPKHMYHLPNP